MKNTAKRNCIEKDDIEEVEEIPVSRDSVKNTIFDIAADMFFIKESDKDNFEEMELEHNANCDTLDIVEFMMNLEDEFGIIISEDDSDRLVTFEDCIDLVWNKVASENDMLPSAEE